MSDSVACGVCGEWIPDGVKDCPKCSRALPTRGAPDLQDAAIVGAATTAGAALGVGAGAAVGFVVAGPVGAGVGYLVGCAGGTAVGIRVGQNLKNWANRLRGKAD